MKHVEAYFIDYPARKQCFTTSDGTVFHERGDANLHAQSLEDKNVDQHERPVDGAKDDAAVKEPKAPTVPKVPKTPAVPKAPKAKGAKPADDASKKVDDGGSDATK